LKLKQKVLWKDVINFDKARHLWFFGKSNIGKSTWLKLNGYLGEGPADVH